MFKKLDKYLHLVTSPESFEAFLEEVMPVKSTSIMAGFNKAARPHLERPTEYPTLVSASETGMMFIPVREITDLLKEGN